MNVAMQHGNTLVCMYSRLCEWQLTFRDVIPEYGEWFHMKEMLNTCLVDLLSCLYYTAILTGLVWPRTSPKRFLIVEYSCCVSHLGITTLYLTYVWFVRKREADTAVFDLVLTCVSIYSTLI